MCFRIGEFTWSSCPLFQPSWLPPCAPGTCDVVPVSWPGVCQKSSWSFVISVIYLQFLRIFSFAILYQLLSFLSNFWIVTSGVTTACSPHHHTPFITKPYKPHPHQQVHLTFHFTISPHFSEFIQTMKPAATPLRRSTKNAKDAPSSVQHKAPPPSAQAPPTKNQQKPTKSNEQLLPHQILLPAYQRIRPSCLHPFFHSRYYCW